MTALLEFDKPEVSEELCTTETISSLSTIIQAGVVMEDSNDLAVSIFDVDFM